MPISLLKRLTRTAGTEARNDAEAPRTRISGLHGNARVDSEFGLVPIALLRKGDRVRSLNGAFVRIAAVDICRFDAAMMEARADLRPIRISPDALAPGLPAETIVIAPDQQVCAPGTTRRKFVSASEFSGIDGVDRGAAIETGYYSLCLETPAVLRAEGLEITA